MCISDPNHVLCRFANIKDPDSIQEQMVEKKRAAESAELVG